MNTTSFERAAVLEGAQTQRALAETPSTFGTVDGATQRPVEPKPLDRPTPRAGQRQVGNYGYRAVQLMTDPNEQMRVHQWMNQFQGNSPAGVQWLNSKLQGAQIMAAMMSGGQQQ
jgi:hypothetical protein